VIFLASESSSTEFDFFVAATSNHTQTFFRIFQNLCVVTPKYSNAIHDYEEITHSTQPSYFHQAY